jgi:hypothetical protein
MISNAYITSLCSGNNATGFSTLLTLDNIKIRSGERTILSRCFINTGDCSQRFCGDNRIKLSRVTCIILTSFAPHNTSGLPGMLLSLSALVSL